MVDHRTKKHRKENYLGRIQQNLPKPPQYAELLNSNSPEVFLLAKSNGEWNHQPPPTNSLRIQPPKTQPDAFSSFSEVIAGLEKEGRIGEKVTELEKEARFEELRTAAVNGHKWWENRQVFEQFKDNVGEVHGSMTEEEKKAFEGRLEQHARPADLRIQLTHARARRTNRGKRILVVFKTQGSTEE